ncbi:MAG TPA: hypothetical protein VMD75_01200 [Candidatus Binataceae bacterium]|nr:hypothetical protein [Candidatus Binataceae bacterium]
MDCGEFPANLFGVFLILALLTCPLGRPHQFADHFRNPEIGRSIESHTPLCEPNRDNATERISIANHQQLDVITEAPHSSKIVEQIEPPPAIPIPRQLLRLRLHSRHRRVPDPLV